MHIIEIIIAGLSAFYLLFILLKYLRNNKIVQIGNDSNLLVKFFIKKFYIVIMILSIILFIFTIAILVVVINLSATNDQIGLYEKDDLLDIVVINIIMSLLNIFFSIMCFIFSFCVKYSCDRLQQNNNANSIQVNNAQNQVIPQQNIENVEVLQDKKESPNNYQNNAIQSERIEVKPNSSQNEN